MGHSQKKEAWEIRKKGGKEEKGREGGREEWRKEGKGRREGREGGREGGKTIKKEEKDPSSAINL